MVNRHAASCGTKEFTAPGSRRRSAAFDLDELFAAAQLQRTEPSSLSPCFVPAYQRLAEALTEEAALTPAGVDVARRRLVSALGNQIKVRELVEAHAVDPELYGDDAVFVLGLPGTGLYRLQRLLNQHSAFNIPSLWEILSPSAEWHPWQAAGASDDPFERALWSHLGQCDGFRPPDLGAPYGDHLLLTYAFHTFSAALEYRIPSYSRWLHAQDTTTAYEFHRYALAVILQRVSGGTPLLVNEFHSLQLPSLFASYPTARVIRVHRDPLESLSNVVGVSTTRRRAWSTRVDPVEATSEWAGQLGAAMSVPSWSDPAPPGAAVLDVTHAEVLQTPLLTVRRICEFAGVPLPGGIERRVLEQVSQFEGTLEERHFARPDETTLPEDFRALRAAYCRRWGLSSC
ncbi:sulfotransferase [Streptomyces cinereoruber]|uniref:sulfotransferase family protein n=1 Tax=Streptomyces cinereoruber TaxID=67260 RepID=UPI003EBC6CED